MKSLFMLCLVCFALPPYPVHSGENLGRAALDGPDSKGLGIFRDSESPSASFKVRNAGDGLLKITRIMKTCGCAGAEADKENLEPGATATVRVAIAPYTLEGAFSKSVFVLTDTAGAPPLRLTVTGECVPLFSVRPSKSVDTGRLPGGSGWKGAFELEASAPAALGQPAVTSDCPAAVSVDAASGSTAEHPRWVIPVALTPPSNSVFRCRLVVPVLSPTNRPPLVLEVAGRAGAELFAVPGMAVIPQADEPVTRTVRVRLSGSRTRRLDPLHLSVTPALEGLDVRTETESGGGLSVTLTVSPALCIRLAKGSPVKVNFSVPDASPAVFTLQALSPENILHSGQR